MKRTTQLRRMIQALQSRIEHLAAQAAVLEAGTVEVNRKFDGEEPTTREERLRFHYSPAVAYWKEVRETEGRLEALRAELRRLLEGGEGRPLEVFVHYDGPPPAEEPAAEALATEGAS